MDGCIFCNPDKHEISIIKENLNTIAAYDSYPVNKGHALLFTKKHFETWFDVPDIIQKELVEGLNDLKNFLDDKYHPSGYNVGINCGESAGQTIMHVHMHLIPRYANDVTNPRGGVRAVIPDKQFY